MEKSSSCGVFSLDAAAGFISFTGNQTRAHREGGQLGLDSRDSLKRFSDELITFAWNEVSVVKKTSPRLS